MSSIFDVPIVEQSRGYCGPASLRCVLAYFGLDVTEQRIARWASASRRYGTWGEGLVLAARKAGFLARIRDKSSLKDLDRALKNGPVIVAWRWNGGGHYSVVRGLGPDFVYMMEPAMGQYTQVLRNEFVQTWFDYEDEGEIPGNERRVSRRMIVVEPWHPGRIR